MRLRNLLISVLTTCATFSIPAQSALGQDAPQCTLDQISQALNSLDCSVNGVFISPDSLVQTITTTCDQTLDPETCHMCFGKLGGKMGPALKALVKLRLLPRKSLSTFRIALFTAEETTCLEKEEPNEGDEQEDPQQPDQPPYPGFGGSKPQYPGFGGSPGFGRNHSSEGGWDNSSSRGKGRRGQSDGRDKNRNF